MTDDKKYYLRHKWICDDRAQYLRQNEVTGGYFLRGGTADAIYNWRVKFTGKEIEEIKKKFDTTLSDFEIIEAKR